MPQQVLNTTTPMPADTTPVDTPEHVYYAPQYADGFPAARHDTLATPAPKLPAALVTPKTATPGAARHALVNDTASMTLLLAVIFLLMVSYRSGYKYIENFFHNMFSVRRRESLFANRTVNETQILSALVLLTCVAEGIIAYFALPALQPSLAAAMQQRPAVFVLTLSGIALVFYLAQLAVFRLLGYIFSDKVSTKLFLDGFKASQSMLGLLLLPVAALLLATNEMLKPLLIIAIIFYFAARVVFLSKGFRIFYGNLLSHVYFILYLCGVEIVPLILLCAGTIALCNRL